MFYLQNCTILIDYLLLQLRVAIVPIKVTAIKFLQQLILELSCSMQENMLKVIFGLMTNYPATKAPNSNT